MTRREADAVEMEREDGLRIWAWDGVIVTPGARVAILPAPTLPEGGSCPGAEAQRRVAGTARALAAPCAMGA